jgi:hypothetical protein
MADFALGRIQAPDDRHLLRYPLTAGTAPTVPTSGVFGINWYSRFDDPTEKDGASWIGLDSDFGYVRGGHAICSLSPHQKDLASWWGFYVQPDGSCTGFSTCRVLSLNNRKRFAAHKLYEEAQRIDDFADTPPQEGSTVRAAMEVARTEGPRIVRGANISEPALSQGIDAYRWSLSVEDIAASLSPGDAGSAILRRGYFVLLQSWGLDYPHFTRLTLEAAERLLREDGEYAVPTDR